MFRRVQLGAYISQGVQQGLAGKTPKRTIAVAPALPMDAALFGVEVSPRATFGYREGQRTMSILNDLLGEVWDVHGDRYVTRLEVRKTNDSRMVFGAFFATFDWQMDGDYCTSLRRDIIEAR